MADQVFHALKMLALVLAIALSTFGVWMFIGGRRKTKK
jgi:hypothetical protein